MIPRDFIYNCMFIYLYNFANGKILLYIFGLYILLPIYFQINDSSILGMFISFYLILLTQPFFINNDLKKSFTRYKKYLRLKRIRAHRFEESKLKKSKEKLNWRNLLC